MIRTGSITSPGRTVTLAAPVQHGSMGVDARPEGPLASLGHVTKGELCREQALVFWCGHPSDTSKPCSRLYAGMPEYRPGACCRQGSVTCGFSPLGKGLSLRLTCFPDNGLRDAAGVGLQGSGRLVVNEDDLVLTKESDRVLRAEGRPDVNAAAGPPPARRQGFRPREQQVQGW